MSARPRIAAVGANRLQRLATAHLRAVRATLERLRRRWLSTLITAFVIGVTLALPMALHTALERLAGADTGWQSALRGSLFLKDTVPEDAGEALARKIGQRPEIADARYISRAQALAEFRAHSGFGEALDLLQGNPLPAVIVVTPKTDRPGPAVQAALRQLAALPEVDFAKFDQQWLERLYAIVAVVRGVVLALAALLLVAVIAVIGNSIRLDIESSREEIAVLRLIGASHAFVRRPFLYTGLWYGLAGSLIACLLVWAGVLSLAEPVRHLAGLYGSTLSLPGPSGHDVLLLFLLGPVLGWLCAFWTVSRWLGADESA